MRYLFGPRFDGVQAVHRSHGLGVVPGQQLFDVRLFVPASNGCQDGGQIALGLDPVEFAGLDQGRDDGPVLCASIMACEERIFAIEGQFPFLLPMSGRFIGFIIDGMPILART